LPDRKPERMITQNYRTMRFFFIPRKRVAPNAALLPKENGYTVQLSQAFIYRESLYEPKNLL
jgi:hypothetical protein